MTPDYSICLLTYNRKEQLALRWGELYGLYGTREDVEMCILDNGSTDGTRGLLDRLGRPDGRGWKLVKKSLPENIGFAAGTNELVTLSTGKTIVLLCDDVRVFGDILTPMQTVIDAYAGLAVVCNHDVPTAYTWNQFNDWKVTIPYLEMDICAMRRSVWDDVGGIDTRFQLLSYQDLDWCYRASQKGYILRGFVRPDGTSDLPVLHTSMSGQTRRDTIVNRAIFAAKWGLRNSPEAP